MVTLVLGAVTLYFSLTHTAMSNTANSADPFLWLEDVEGERALTWVRAQNERSLKQLTSDRRYEGFYQSTLAILEDKSRIPYGSHPRRLDLQLLAGRRERSRPVAHGRGRRRMTRRIPSGKRCWISTRSRRRKIATGCGRAPPACSRRASVAW